MVYVVALTGGICSGKSTVASVFAQHGVSTINSDAIAKSIVKPGTKALHAIVSYFGYEITNDKGTLNRRLLRERVFSSHGKKRWLNALLHPLIYKEVQRQISLASFPYVLWEIPLLFENKLHKKVHQVLVVDVIPEIQIQRVILRDNISHKHAKQILLSQAKREKRLSIANDIIDNNGAPENFISDVSRLHKKYLSQSIQSSFNFYRKMKSKNT